MVGGLGKFREAFADFSDNFVIIGGTACDEVLSGTEMTPRATLDIDIVVIVENMTNDFAAAFWNFIRAGGYRPGKRKNQDGTPKYVLYSFDNGRSGFPLKIELLARHNDIFESAAHTEPLPIFGEVSSLSAIILDEPYYNLTVFNSFISEGLRYASPLALMALKARAYINLLTERANGKEVNTKDISKHRNDVIKLAAITPGTEQALVGKEVVDTINEFTSLMLSSLPNQSMQDALRRNDTVLRTFINSIPGHYILQQ